VLLRTDLPYIAHLVAPRKLFVSGAVDARGQAVPVKTVSELYGEGVEVRATADWNEEVLGGLGG
jgi:hypothetical protein